MAFMNCRRWGVSKWRVHRAGWGKQQRAKLVLMYGWSCSSVWLKQQWSVQSIKHEHKLHPNIINMYPAYNLSWCRMHATFDTVQWLTSKHCFKLNDGLAQNISRSSDALYSTSGSGWNDPLPQSAIKQDNVKSLTTRKT